MAKLPAKIICNTSPNPGFNSKNPESVENCRWVYRVLETHNTLAATTGYFLCRAEVQAFIDSGVSVIVKSNK